MQRPPHPRRVAWFVLALLSLGASGTTAATREAMVATGDLAPGEPFDARFVDLRTIGITSDTTAVIWGATEGHGSVEGIPVPVIFLGAGLWTWDSTNGIQRLQTEPLGFDWRSLDLERIAVGADGRVVLAVSNGLAFGLVDRLLDCHVGQVGCSVLATTGDTVAGLPDGWTLDELMGVDLDASGAVAFTASIDTGDPLAYASGVFAFTDQAALVAATGDALAEPSTVELGAFNGHVHSAMNAIAFANSSLQCFGCPSAGPPLLARWTPGAGLEGLMVAGEPAPGGDPGMRFLVEFDVSGVVSSFDLGAEGTLAFASSMGQATPPHIIQDSGIWRCKPGSACALLVHQGDSVPGTDDGSVFYAWETTRAFDGVRIGPSGTIGFAATFLSGENPGHLGGGIFALDPDGGLRTLARGSDADPAGDGELGGPLSVEAIGPQDRVLFGRNYVGIYASEPGGQVWSVMHDSDPIDPATVHPVAARVKFDASDADVEHVALRAYTDLSVSPAELTLVFATLPEPGALASAAASALALSALARRRS